LLKRVVLKLSGEYLAGGDDAQLKHIDYAAADKIITDIVKVIKTGVQVAVVVGGGNFWRGRDAAAEFDRAHADYMGMLASVMNGIFLSERFYQKGVRARVLTPFAVGGMTEVYNTIKAAECLENGHIVIFAGGTGQPFFSTDTITIIRAAELKADMALFAKDVPGVCDCDPRDAAPGSFEIYRQISASEMISKNLTVVDVAAMILARDNEVNCAVFDISANNAIATACLGTKEILSIGTVISYM